MTVLAIINPQSLLGDEIKQELSRKRELWSEVRLLATDSAQVGAVTELDGDAALVQECNREALAGVRLAILLPGEDDQDPSELSLPEDSTLIVVDPSADWPAGVLAVAGLESLEAESAAGGIFICPSPVVVLLAHLLQPLRDLRPSLVVAQVLEPASQHGQAGLEELFEQTRAILAMRDERPTEVFGKQIAFNLLPGSPDTARYVADLATLLGDETSLSLQIVQAGVFHSLACSLFVSFEEDPGIDGIRDRLADHPGIEMVGDEELPGPTDAAARDEILVSGLRASPSRPGSYQLWAVMDNLRRGGASNVIEILEGLLARAS